MDSFNLNTNDQDQQSTHLPTGSLMLDIALGAGGIPGGSIVEISGPTSCGKTSLCLSIMAEANRLGWKSAMIDSDQTLSLEHLHTYHLIPDQCFISQTPSAEQAFSIIETLVRSSAIKVIALDSLSSLVTGSELQANLGTDHSPGVEDQFSRLLSRLGIIIRKTKTILIITCLQDSRKSTVYHKLARHTSRLALKLHANTRIQLKPGLDILEKGTIAGKQVLASLIKNQFGSCCTTVNLDIMYNDGVIKHGDVLKIGLHLKLITESSDLFYYRDQVLGRTIQECTVFLKTNPWVRASIESEIRHILFSGKKLINSEDKL